MHLKAVGKALLFGLALVDWDSRAAQRRPQQGESPPRAPAQPRRFVQVPRPARPRCHGAGPCSRDIFASAQ
eukprot:9372244-Lingulodinium_polyedra.AAC.1